MNLEKSLAATVRTFEALKTISVEIEQANDLISQTLKAGANC